MEKESIPVALEDKYVQRFSVKWILTPRKQFAFRKTNKQTIDFNINAQLRSLFLYRAFSRSVAML